VIIMIKNEQSSRREQRREGTRLQELRRSNAWHARRPPTAAPSPPTRGARAALRGPQPTRVSTSTVPCGSSPALAVGVDGQVIRCCWNSCRSSCPRNSADGIVGNGKLIPVSDAKCLNGHLLPEGFHHQPEDAREPCPICGSTGRLFPVTASITENWRVYSDERPEAEATRTVHSYTVRCERLPEMWMIEVYDGNEPVGKMAVAEDAQDAGLAAGMTLAEVLESID
jgi:hypothetical protein